MEIGTGMGLCIVFFKRYTFFEGLGLDGDEREDGGR